MSTFCLRVMVLLFPSPSALSAVRTSFLFSSAFSSIVMSKTKQEVQTKQPCSSVAYCLYLWVLPPHCYSFLLMRIFSSLCLHNANHARNNTQLLSNSDHDTLGRNVYNCDALKPCRLKSKTISKVEDLNSKVLSRKQQSKISLIPRAEEPGGL